MNKIVRRRQKPKHLQTGLNRDASRNLSGIMATLSAAILAIASIFTAFISYSTWQHVQETSRPYFSLTDAPKLETANSQTLSMHFINAGEHPAEGLKSHITVTLAETGETVLEEREQVLNAMPKGTESFLLVDLAGQGKGEKEFSLEQECYMTLWLSYYDPLLQKNFEQNFFLKSSGFSGDNRDLEITHMTRQELQDLLDTVKNNRETQPWNPLIE